MYKYENINSFPISYAFQPHLRDRLTLGRLPLPRKPWVYGERVFHPFYRYLCQHNHFSAVQSQQRGQFDDDGAVAIWHNEEIGDQRLEDESPILRSLISQK